MNWERNYEHEMHNGGGASGSQPFYDTCAGVRRLTETGIEEAHAEAIVNEQFHAVGQGAGKADIMILRQEFRAEIKDVKASIVMWGAGYSLAITALVVTLIKLP